MYLIVELEVTHSAVSAAIVDVVVGRGERVHACHSVGASCGHPVPIAVADLRLVDIALSVSEIHGLGRIEGKGAAHRVVGPIGLLIYSLCVQVYAQVVVQELGRHADVDVSSLVVTHLDGSLVEVVAHAHAEGEPAARVEADIVVGIDTYTVYKALPISVIQSSVNSQQVSRFRTVLLDVCGESLSVHHLDGVLVLLCGYASAVADVQTLALALLGGDDDHTVGCPGTVDGGCGSVLEHGVGLDVVGVDGSQRITHSGTTFLGHRHTVDDDERVVGSGKGSGSSDSDG